MPFPVAEQFIIATERKLGVSFPSAFRARIARENGGELSTAKDSWHLHPVFDTSDRKRISRTSNDIVRETKSAREWYGFPAEAIAIGSNGCGDCLVFVPGSDRSLQLFIWQHETGELQPTDYSFESES